MEAQEISVQVQTTEIRTQNIFPVVWGFFLQIILSSTVNVNKNAEHEALAPWLGDGIYFKRGKVSWE
jgi:hypothetical protein